MQEVPRAFRRSWAPYRTEGVTITDVSVGRSSHIDVRCTPMEVVGIQIEGQDRYCRKGGSVSGDPRRPMVRTVVVITIIAAFVAVGAIVLWTSLR